MSGERHGLTSVKGWVRNPPETSREVRALMKLFKCQVCGQVLSFENTRCERCGARLGYLPHADRLAAVEPVDDGWAPVGAPEPRFRFCQNAEADCCNWLVSSESTESFCVACRHNGVVPDPSQPDALLLWQKIEWAKHRLFYSLIRLKLPLQTRGERPTGLIFDFPADGQAAGAPRIVTGHDNGRITIALAEADDAERERRRTTMHEPYRTLLGHFRHEIGHYYWDRLVNDSAQRSAYRALFGDERHDYGQALKDYYEHGAPADWRERFVSAYAASHPWEDFAETWAHYFHIVDTLEMAHALGVSVSPTIDYSGELAGRVAFDPYRAARIEDLIDAWLPATFAFNSINRCMGHADLYPFVLTPAVIAKLGYIQQLIHNASNDLGSAGMCEAAP